MKPCPVVFLMLALCLAGQNVSRAQLLISEYVEGTSNNKGLEIWNTSLTNVTFGSGAGQVDARVTVFANGSASATSTIILTPGFTLLPGEVFVVAHSSASFAAAADQTTTSASWNGDDAITLSIGGTNVLDSLGQVGVDPGTEWGTGIDSTADNTLRRSVDATGGDVNPADPYDMRDHFWGYPVDSFDDLGIPPGGPRLAVQFSPGAVVVSWAAAATGYRLQHATALAQSGTAWGDVAQAPVLSGKRLWATNNVSGTTRFFRLIK